MQGLSVTYIALVNRASVLQFPSVQLYYLVAYCHPLVFLKPLFHSRYRVSRLNGDSGHSVISVTCEYVQAAPEALELDLEIYSRPVANAAALKCSGGVFIAVC